MSHLKMSNRVKILNSSKYKLKMRVGTDYFKSGTDFFRFFWNFRLKTQKYAKNMRKNCKICKKAQKAQNMQKYAK